MSELQHTPAFDASLHGAALEAISDEIDALNVAVDHAHTQVTFSHININTSLAPQADSTARSTPTPTPPPKDESTFRAYATAPASVKAFYAEQHSQQTVAYNLFARSQYFPSRIRARMSIWDAMEKLNTLVDDSDPDTSLSQIEHLLQTAEAMRRDGQPRWVQVTGLIHDLGKLLCFFGARGQWDVVGDTFPVGCAVEDESVIFGRESFTDNEDYGHAIYGTETGIYAPGCGMDKVMISWGHDEYLYRVVREQSTLPEEALAIIRYHSFYPWHREGGYRWLMDKEGRDEKMLDAVKRFNPYDLYSKADGVPDVEALKPYYLDLIDEFFPQKVINW